MVKNDDGLKIVMSSVEQKKHLYISQNPYQSDFINEGNWVNALLTHKKRKFWGKAVKKDVFVVFDFNLCIKKEIKTFELY